MKTPTFQEQYNKIVNAYYKNTLQPHNSCACFIGNLLNNNDTWHKGRTLLDNTSFLSPYVKIGEWSGEGYDNYVQEAKECLMLECNNLYSMKDIMKMEQHFLRIVNSRQGCEETLFRAMESTLLILRELHESKAEVIQDYNFTKRELV